MTRLNRGNSLQIDGEKRIDLFAFALMQRLRGSPLRDVGIGHSFSERS
jgi:hypothetical protein